MSHFSTALTHQLAKTTQAEIATASGIPRSSVAQYSTGDRGISVTALGQLLQAFPDREDRLALVRAHLRDEIPAEVYDEIEIHIRDNFIVREAPPTEPWKKDLEAALELLRVSAEHDPDVRRLVLDLAKVL